MTSDLARWLSEATAGLPPEVAQRVCAEYAAHLADAQAAGVPEAEALPALGDPVRVRRALHRTYLGEERLRTLQTMPTMPLITGVVWGLPTLYALLTAWNYADSTPFPWWRLAAPALTLLLTVGVWGLTRRLPGERRNLWRGGGGGLSIQFMLWGQWVLQVWHGEDFVWPWFLPVFGLMLLGLLLWTVLEDARLRRTLALQGERA